MNAQALSHWLLKLKEEVGHTNSRYRLNLVQGWPIPFFGDPLRARVLTVGVNPSNQEFNPDRQWDAITNPEQWQKRVLNYFGNPDVPSWYWFETWSICLDLICHAYAAGDAAHIDVSPRPTAPMLDARTDPKEFRAMVEHDVKWFFELLSNLPQVQLLLVAGPIPRANGHKQQLADFIREQAGRHGVQWRQADPLPTLITPGNPKGISVFVCPYEPKVDGLYAMVRQVHRHRVILRRLSAPKTGSVCLLPARLDWPSAIGNFIANFGMMDLLLHDYLEANLPPGEFLRFKERPLYDRVERIKEHLSQADWAPENEEEFERFLRRFGPLRELRNHIAHGILRIGFSLAQEPSVRTLSLPRDLDDSNSPDSKHVEFAELVAALATLTELIEEFQALARFKTPDPGKAAKDSQC